MMCADWHSIVKSQVPMSHGPGGVGGTNVPGGSAISGTWKMFFLRLETVGWLVL